MYVESRVGNKPTILPRATYCLASTESEATGPASVKRKSSGYFLTLAGIRSACLTFEFSPSARRQFWRSTQPKSRFFLLLWPVQTERAIFLERMLNCGLFRL